MSKFHKHCAWGAELKNHGAGLAVLLRKQAGLFPVACQPQRDGESIFSLLEFHSPEGAPNPLKVSYQARTEPNSTPQFRAQIISAEEDGLAREYTEWNEDVLEVHQLVYRRLEKLGYPMDLCFSC